MNQGALHHLYTRVRIKGQVSVIKNDRKYDDVEAISFPACKATT